jgi:hypothetical protein
MLERNEHRMSHLSADQKQRLRRTYAYWRAQRDASTGEERSYYAGVASGVACAMLTLGINPDAPEDSNHSTVERPAPPAPPYAAEEERWIPISQAVPWPLVKYTSVPQTRSAHVRTESGRVATGRFFPTRNEWSFVTSDWETDENDPIVAWKPKKRADYTKRSKPRRSP